MIKRTFLVILLIIGFISVCALAAPVQKQPGISRQSIANKVNISEAPSTPELPVMCNQPYGLCDTAACSISESDPTKVICTCPVVDGVSMGQVSCPERAPVDMYLNEEGEWMIKAGVPVGQVISTYSFLNAAPSKVGEINPNTTPEDYTGDEYIKTCSGGDWADCFDKPCYVPSADPLADVKTDRLAADYAICECGIVTDITDYVIVGSQESTCTNKTICQDYLWSAGDQNLLGVGLTALAKYLKEHPEDDPEQAYVMMNCPNCKPCAEWAEVNMTEIE